MPGEEADGDDGDGDDDDADAEGDAMRGTATAESCRPSAVVGPVAVTVFSIMAACLPLEAACLGT